MSARKARLFTLHLGTNFRFGASQPAGQNSLFFLHVKSDLRELAIDAYK